MGGCNGTLAKDWQKGVETTSRSTRPPLKLCTIGIAQGATPNSLLNTQLDQLHTMCALCMLYADDINDGLLVRWVCCLAQQLLQPCRVFLQQLLILHKARHHYILQDL